MIEQLPEHMPWLAKLNYNIRESIYQFALFGMTSPQIVDTKVVMTAIIIGVGSAYAASYANAERNAVKLDATIQRLEAANREQAEFRQEIRATLTAVNSDRAEIGARLSRVEGTMVALHPQIGMSGNGNGNGNGRPR